MAADQSILIPRVKLGNQGFEVSKLGFGCMGLSRSYIDPVLEDVGISIIKHAFGHGVTFFDTSDLYGANNANENLVGKALKQLPREKVQLATKFGIVKFDYNLGVVINGTPEYVRSCCEASLKCLDVEYIDLYYQHRIDTSVPIEDTMGELKKLVEEGKIKYIGLSEASPDTIRRANAVHPITAIQMEWSLWTRDIEEEIPSLPRFSGENFDKNKKLYWNLEKLTEKHECTPAQLALSWILHQGDDVVPIPGFEAVASRESPISHKFGIVKFDYSSGVVINGTPEYVRSCCEASLKRLDVEYIDLYYQHQIDTSVPIEDTMGELKKLVEEGKIKYIGLSEASPDTIRRANAVHPITAIQMEWSLWTRDIEEEIVPLCRELGIGIVPYSPLGRGFFVGRAVVESIPANSFLASIPRFSGENFDKNKKLY
ncbi:hypothetical protein LWI29_024551 [Acer saccharum]|uniref:NADP-dependent oxidoreductase domain-containing protein n=1 Tax=Acer saccharum TaxID=4024 RepID=A0AA39W3K1_ACESA|nr:hypothetical protein LWI29_024551 [Acer saccharum]